MKPSALSMFASRRTDSSPMHDGAAPSEAPKVRRRALPALLCALAAAAGLGAVSAPADPLPSQVDLRTAIGYALEHNYAIREARERIRQQQGLIVQAKGRTIPNLSAAGSYQVNTQSISQTEPSSSTFWQGAVTATQTLYAGGGVKSAIKGAELGREAAQLDLQATVNASLLDVRTRFYTVILDRDRLHVQEENIDLLKSQLKDASDRFEAGTTSSFDRLRAEVALANGQVPLITARNDLRIAIEQLRQSMGLSGADHPAGGPTPEFVGSLTYDSTSFDLESCLGAARANRPEIARLGRVRDANEQSVITARSNYYPSVALTGGWEIEKEPFALYPNSPSSVNGWYAGLKSQWSIFDGGSTRGQVAQARSVLEQSRLSLDEQTLAIEVAVRQAFSSWQEAAELAAATEKTVGQAEESLRLAKARYEAGTAAHLDVLQSQVDLTQARNNQLQANYTQAVAVAQLKQAMGVADEFSIK